MFLHNQYSFNPNTDLIAKGGFAEVYRAYDHNLNKTVAIKRFVKEAGSAGSVIKEIQKSIDFSHPNIIRYFNCFSKEYNDHLGRNITEEYGVMEYANAGSLSDVMSGKRKITTEQFKELILGILDGLAYLHSRSPAIIHRDLKPSNILLHEENGQLIPKICDFGISKELQGTISQTATAALGTIDYMSPEQIEGKAASPATDFWSLGCIIYEHFNGQPPFGKASQGASAQQVYWKVMNGKLDEGGMKKVPEPFRVLVKGCLVVDFSKRVKSASEAKKIVNGEDKSGGGITVPSGVAKKILAGVAVLFLAVLVWILWPYGEGKTNQVASKENVLEPTSKELPAVIPSFEDNNAGSVADAMKLQAEQEKLAAEKAALEAEKKEVEKQKQAEAERQRLQREQQEEARQAEAVRRRQQEQSSRLPAPIQKLLNDMVRIPGGTFMMGCSPGDDECSDDERPRHQVTLSSFNLGKYEVTQAQWRAVMGSDPPKLYNKGCDQCPVERISWDDVQDFIKKLNQMTGKSFRLPTEAEWEYAARGGTTSRFYTGNCLSANQANYDGNHPASGCSAGEYRGKTLPVGSFSPNSYGLYDMSGNVWEWCNDWHGDYNSSSKTNPKGPISGVNRVIRGGCWFHNAQFCRVSNRDGDTPTNHYFSLGFRLALSQ
jgi:formylglycine-generating enzyme required for sulfatase activity